MEQADFIIVGAGIAGASLGYFLAPHGRVLMLERESQPGYHSTGRSAALFSETYGCEQVQILSRASRAFLEHPPEGFAQTPILSPRGVAMVANPGDEAGIEQELAALQRITPSVRGLTPSEVLAMVPVLRPETTGAAILEPDACDIDVHTLHQGFLRGFKQRGGSLICDAQVDAIEAVDAGWQVRCGDRVFAAARLVNAAGAWADALARLAGVQPIGLTPKRRSAFTFAAPEGQVTRDWPMVMALDESWYLKPDAGALLGSPANADPVEPHDVQAEELDIATAIYNIETATTLSIRRPIRVWAGLRSFVADGGLVGGPAVDAPGFFWLAAQGGYGIQTCAAMGEACAALLRGVPIPAHLADLGVTAEILSPARASLQSALSSRPG